MKRLLKETAYTFGCLLFLFLNGTASEMPAREITGLHVPPQENPARQVEGFIEKPFRIRVEAAMVSTDVTVIGAAAADLQADDFVLYDNGIVQTLTHFSRDQLPLAVVLLIDSSASIGPYLPVLQIAALSALRRLRPDDQVALFSFDTDPVKLGDLTEDHLAIARKINRLKVGGGTNIFDPLCIAARYLRDNARNRRRAVILISDNCHTVPGKHNAEQSRVEMLEASATLYGIKTSGDYCVDSHERVKRIANETGGEVLDAGASTSLQAALEKAVSNLRLQYTLGFTPSNPGENGSFHKLTVKLAAEDRCPGCRLLARSGYYAGITAPFPSSGGTPKTPQNSAGTTDQALVQRSIFTAGTTALDLADIPFTAHISEQTDSQGRHLRVDLQIDLVGTKAKIVGERHICKLHVTVFYADAGGKILGSDWKTLEGSLSGESWNRILKTGVPFSTTIPVKAKKQMLKIVVFDEESGRIGSKLIRLP